ncbi:MAG TPA: NADH-quinone oxidoreductase subunit J [Solirubrobacteraceae bacterium]|jgi:NADH:ubiquinone oxidoreductase subunit 6 (subunit J)|nr:NADH-quinone oxidoreductase subunit J [Solirubrobacteraceae bacterium]
MSAVLFFLAALGVIAGALGVVLLRDAFYSVLALVFHLVCLAVLFLLLRSEFVAAVQVVVYAGAVMVLYVFVVAYVGGEPDRFDLGRLSDRSAGQSARMRIGATVLGAALLVELMIALLGTGLEGVRHQGAPYSPGPETFGTPAYVGKLLLTRFLLVFEVASFLLLIAAVGAVVLARRRRGLEQDLQEPQAQLHRATPRDAGSMAEGVGGGPATQQAAGVLSAAVASQPTGSSLP